MSVRTWRRDAISVWAADLLKNLDAPQICERNSVGMISQDR